MRIAIVLTVLVALAAAESGKFAKLVKKDPSNVAAWLSLADALVAETEPEEAWTQLEAGIEANPKDDRLRLKLGDIFVKLAEKEQAGNRNATTIDNFYLDAIRLYEEAHTLRKSADAIYGKAFASYWMGRPEGKVAAKKLLGEALMLDAKHARSHALQADIMYNDGRVEKDGGKRKVIFANAEQKYEIAAKLFDGQPLMFVRWGHACYGQGKLDAARNAYFEGLRRHQDSDASIRSGFYLLAKQGDAAGYYVRLTSMLEEGIKIAPKSDLALWHLGVVHTKTKRYEDALDVLQKAHKLKPNSQAYAYWIGYTHESARDLDKALAWYEKTLKIDSTFGNAIYGYQRIIGAKFGRDTDQTEKHFEKLLKLAPENADIRNNLGLILRDWAQANGAAGPSPGSEAKRRIKRSGEVYEEAAALLPNSPQVLSDTGLLFEFYPCNFDAEKAKRYFTASLEKSEFVYRDAFDGLTRLCRRMKDWETLEEYAEGVLGAMERGKNPIAPVGGGAPRELPNARAGMMARAKAAYELALRGLKKKS